MNIFIFILAGIGALVVACFIVCLISYLILDWGAEREWKKHKKSFDTLSIHDAIKKGDDTQVF